MVLDFEEAEQVINKDVYGHFAEHLGRCIYDGIWVGPASDIPNYKGYRLDVLEALKALDIPVLRWPGGCFADTYNWKEGVGPREQRPTLVNVFWGGVVEDNSFGTHEFLDLCELLGCDAYIAANVGSGSVREMIEWIEYMTSDNDSPMANWRKENGREAPWNVKFIGIGNENWGCGGNMTPDYYVNLMRQYSGFARNYGGRDLVRVGCGANSFDFNWTEVVMREGRNQMDALSLHYYTIPSGNWGAKTAATGFEEDMYFGALKNGLRMDELLQGHLEIMDRFDPRERIELYVDEWGIWTDPEPGTNPGFLHQQNSMRDALIAAFNFDIFHRYASRVKMANIAQTVNVLQAMVLTENDKMILTPTYHVFDMYKFNQNATYIPVDIASVEYSYDEESIPAISGTASIKDGQVFIGLSNLHATEAQTIDVDISGGEVNEVVEAKILTAPEFNSYNTYDSPNTVAPAEFADFEIEDGEVKVVLPPYSIVTLILE